MSFFLKDSISKRTVHEGFHHERLTNSTLESGEESSRGKAINFSWPWNNLGSFSPRPWLVLFLSNKTRGEAVVGEWSHDCSSGGWNHQPKLVDEYEYKMTYTTHSFWLVYGIRFYIHSRFQYRILTIYMYNTEYFSISQYINSIYLQKTKYVYIYIYRLYICMCCTI